MVQATPKKGLTRRQSQRRDLSRLVLAAVLAILNGAAVHESRQLPSWLIFDVRREMIHACILAVSALVVCWAGCHSARILHDEAAVTRSVAAIVREEKFRDGFEARKLRSTFL